MKISKKDIFLLIVFLLVILWRFGQTKIKLQDGQRVRLSGRVVSEPIRYERKQAISLHAYKIYLDLYPEITYGDEIVVEGVVDGKYINNPKLIEISQNKPSIYLIREKLILFFEQNLPQPHSSLVAGVVLGSKASLPTSFWENLKSTGTAHVVVASGMNVTLVAGFLMNFFVGFLQRRKAVLLAIVSIWFYVLLSGFDAPIVRAAIMGSIAFSAQALGRLSNAFRALVISAVAMLMFKPTWLTDLGFILSFVATLSILVFNPRIKPLLKRVPKFLQDDFSSTLSAQVGVAPILFVIFGQFNLLSPIINVLVLWTIPPITMIGMLSALTSFIFTPLARIVLYLVYPLTSWFVWVIELFA